MAEGVGFEPTVELPLRLISSQVPSTSQPPFHATRPRPGRGVRQQGSMENTHGTIRRKRCLRASARGFDANPATNPP